MIFEKGGQLLKIDHYLNILPLYVDYLSGSNIWNHKPDYIGKKLDKYEAYTKSFEGVLRQIDSFRKEKSLPSITGRCHALIKEIYRLIEENRRKLIRLRQIKIQEIENGSRT